MPQIEETKVNDDIFYSLTEWEATLDMFSLKEIREKFCHRVLSFIAFTGQPYELKECDRHCQQKCSSVIARQEKSTF